MDHSRIALSSSHILWRALSQPDQLPVGVAHHLHLHHHCLQCSRQETSGKSAINHIWIPGRRPPYNCIIFIYILLSFKKLRIKSIRKFSPILFLSVWPYSLCLGLSYDGYQSDDPKRSDRSSYLSKQTSGEPGA